MRVRKIFAIAITIALSGCGGPSSTSSGGGKSVLTGIVFVTSSVASGGSQAVLPAGTKIYPLGSTISGTDGCSTNQYHTDGIMMAVIDYNGRPTAASLTVTRHPSTGGSFANAPYYLDLNPGRTLQNLGPIYTNGSYDLLFTYDYNQGPGNKASGSFTLSRNCPYN
jgi:hypothetical protein